MKIPQKRVFIGRKLNLQKPVLDAGEALAREAEKHLIAQFAGVASCSMLPFEDAMKYCPTLTNRDGEKK